MKFVPNKLRNAETMDHGKRTLINPGDIVVYPNDLLLWRVFFYLNQILDAVAESRVRWPSHLFLRPHLHYDRWETDLFRESPTINWGSIGTYMSTRTIPFCATENQLLCNDFTIVFLPSSTNSEKGNKNYLSPAGTPSWGYLSYYGLCTTAREPRFCAKGMHVGRLKASALLKGTALPQGALGIPSRCIISNINVSNVLFRFDRNSITIHKPSNGKHNSIFIVIFLKHQNVSAYWELT